MILSTQQIYHFLVKRLKRLCSHDDYIEYQNTKSQILMKYVNEIVEMHDGKCARILEIGAGYGGMTEAMKQIGEQIISIDNNRMNLNLAENDEYLQYICCDALKMPLKNNAFSLIFCISVIEHVEDIKILMSEMNRILKDNAIVIIGFPPWYSMYGGHMNIPFTSFIPAKLRNYLKKYSFIKYYPTNPLTVMEVENEMKKHFDIIDKNSFFLPKIMLINPFQEIEPFVLFVCKKVN